MGYSPEGVLRIVLTDGLESACHPAAEGLIGAFE
jgi:hypothetical protein